MSDVNGFGPDIYTLVDDEGNESLFELLDVLEQDGQTYFAMTPYFEDVQDIIDQDCDLVILKSENVDGEDMFASIEDDDEFERIGEIFLKRLDEIEDGEFDEEEFDEDSE